MPELPDVLAYLTGLQRQIGGRRIDAIQLRSPFLVRTFEPKLDTAVGRRIVGFRRLGKRIVWALEDDLFLVIHLMIAGRFHWKKTGTRPTRKIDLAAFHFDSGTMLLTEAGSKKRASLHVVDGESGLADHDPGGLEVLEADLDAFTEVLKRRNHTLKRALTDPRLFSGIGNAYSDEILHAARLSPVKWTSRLSDEEVASLYAATRSILTDWCTRLQAEAEVAFPEKVTAFRPEMAVHGRYGKPCPVCATAVQEIAYASNETNYCPRCQIKGKVLADRQLSRMLKDDWPKTIEDLEAHRGLTSPDDA
ncbi:MAG: DNA-formamidopyrimidine glycosylase family protein [Candidatus Latescibacterota bacterium]|nr:DNA-formamidopyrimidine glycosylase family protein [Candidatus Latescibacterota bacterium]